MVCCNDLGQWVVHPYLNHLHDGAREIEHHCDRQGHALRHETDQRLIDGQKEGRHRILPLEVERQKRAGVVLVSIRISPRTRALLRTAHNLSSESRPHTIRGQE